jgi:hypothetical protein
MEFWSNGITPYHYQYSATPILQYSTIVFSELLPVDQRINGLEPAALHTLRRRQV